MKNDRQTSTSKHDFWKVKYSVLFGHVCFNGAPLTCASESFITSIYTTDYFISLSLNRIADMAVTVLL